MMTSSNGNIFRVTGHLCGEFTGTAQRPVTRSFDVFFDVCLNKRLSKQSWGWWYETLSLPLWRHRNDRLKNQKRPIRIMIISNKYHNAHTAFDLNILDTLDLSALIFYHRYVHDASCLFLLVLIFNRKGTIIVTACVITIKFTLIKQDHVLPRKLLIKSFPVN